MQKKTQMIKYYFNMTQKQQEQEMRNILNSYKLGSTLSDS